MYKPNRLFRKFHDLSRRHHPLNFFAERDHPPWRSTDFCSFWRMNMFGVLSIIFTTLWVGGAIGGSLVGLVFGLVGVFTNFIDINATLDTMWVFIESTWSVVYQDSVNIVYITLATLFFVPLVLFSMVVGIVIGLLPFWIAVGLISLILYTSFRGVRAAFSKTKDAVVEKLDSTTVGAAFDRYHNKVCRTVDWSDD